MKILAIDPGNEYSGYVIMDSESYKPIDFGKPKNEDILDEIMYYHDFDECVIEMVASYGMPVGKEVFETCVWIGRFKQECITQRYCQPKLIYRKDVKINLCGTTKAKDANITQALKDRFGDKGTKKNPGWFYGFAADVWQAYALGVTYLDDKKSRESE